MSDSRLLYESRREWVGGAKRRLAVENRGESTYCAGCGRARTLRHRLRPRALARPPPPPTPPVPFLGEFSYGKNAELESGLAGGQKNFLGSYSG
jgi:hypothetical protein